MISHCALYCGVFAIYIAHRDNNHKFNERLVDLYKGEFPGKGILPNSEKLSIQEIKCRGCLSNEQFIHCQQCEIRACTREKRYIGCHQCEESPCQHIEAFPMTVGKKVILRAIPYWREVGKKALNIIIFPDHLLGDQMNYQFLHFEPLPYSIFDLFGLLTKAVSLSNIVSNPIILPHLRTVD